MGRQHGVLAALLSLPLLAHTQSRFSECQVDLVEQAQPAGCVAVFGYAVTPQTGTVAADCGKLTAAAQGSGSRGVRSNVNYSPALPEFAAICSLLTLGQSCSVFLVSVGQTVGNLSPCRSELEDYVVGLIQTGRLNGTRVAAFAPSPSLTMGPYTGQAITIAEGPNGLSVAPGPIPQQVASQIVAPSFSATTTPSPSPAPVSSAGR